MDYLGFRVEYSKLWRLAYQEAKVTAKRKRFTSIPSTIALMIIILLGISVSPAAASWTSEMFSNTSTTGQGKTGDFYGVAADGSSMIAVGDDSTSTFGQISTAGSSGQWNFEEDFNGSPSNLVTPNIKDYEVDSLSCASTALCIAVGTLGSAIVYNGSTWSSVTDVDGGSTLTGVSCVLASTYCIAVDDLGNAIIYSGGSWASASSVEVGNALESVSCVATTFCMAVDPTEVFNFNGTSWTGLTIDTAPRQLSSISCGSTGFCIAVDRSGYSIRCSPYCHPSTPWIWSTVTVDSGHTLDSISCPTSSVGSCYAVDAGGYEFLYSSGAWKAGVDIDSSIQINSVACANSYCMAVDEAGDALSCTTAASCSSSTWTKTASIDSNSLSGVSCIYVSTTDTFCLAIDLIGDYLTSTNGTWSTPAIALRVPTSLDLSCSSASFCMEVGVGGEAKSYNGTVWTTTNSSVDLTHSWISVSCISSTFCIAVDNSGNGLVFNGSSWTIASLGSGIIATSVSCASISFCVAVDSNGNYNFYNGSEWGPNSSTYDTDSFAGISCPVGGTFCEAVDTSGGVDMVSGCGSSTCTWTPRSSIDSVGFTAISCIAASWCIAVDSNGDALNSLNNGITWASTLSIDTVAITSVSCFSTALCSAVDTLGQSFTFSGTWTSSSWSTPTAVSPYALNSISCPAANFCVAGDVESNLFTTDQLVTGPLFGIACASINECTAVGVSANLMGPIIISSSNPLNAGTWSEDTIPSSLYGVSALYGVTCASSSSCFAVGTSNSGGAILSSSNGGVTWNEQAIPTYLGGISAIYGIGCISFPVCFAVGSVLDGGVSEGVIIYTSDSGVTWQGEFNTPFGGMLSGISCTSTPECVVTGDGNGYSLIYVDDSLTGSSPSESTWDYYETSDGGMSYLYGVQCPAVSTCIAYGWTSGQATIFVNTAMTTTPGTTWNVQEVGLTGLTYVSPPPDPTSWYAMACYAGECMAVGANNASPAYYPESAYGS